MWEADLIHPINEGALNRFSVHTCTVRHYVSWILTPPDGKDDVEIVIGYELTLQSPDGWVKHVDLTDLTPHERHVLGSFIGRTVAGTQAGGESEDRSRDCGRLTLHFTDGWRVDARRPDREDMVSHTYWDVRWSDDSSISGHFFDVVSIHGAREDDDDEDSDDDPEQDTGFLLLQ